MANDDSAKNESEKLQETILENLRENVLENLNESTGQTNDEIQNSTVKKWGAGVA